MPNIDLRELGYPLSAEGLKEAQERAKAIQDQYSHWSNRAQQERNALRSIRPGEEYNYHWNAGSGPLAERNMAHYLPMINQENKATEEYKKNFEDFQRGENERQALENRMMGQQERLRDEALIKGLSKKTNRPLLNNIRKYITRHGLDVTERGEENLPILLQQYKRAQDLGNEVIDVGGGRKAKRDTHYQEQYGKPIPNLNNALKGLSKREQDQFYRAEAGLWQPQFPENYANENGQGNAIEIPEANVGEQFYREGNRLARWNPDGSLEWIAKGNDEIENILQRESALNRQAARAGREFPQAGRGAPTRQQGLAGHAGFYNPYLQDPGRFADAEDAAEIMSGINADSGRVRSQVQPHYPPVYNVPVGTRPYEPPKQDPTAMRSTTMSIPPTRESQMGDLASALYTHGMRPEHDPFPLAERFEPENPMQLRAREMAAHGGEYIPGIVRAQEMQDKAGSSFSDPAEQARFMNPYEDRVLKKIRAEAMRRFEKHVIPTLNARYAGAGHNRSMALNNAKDEAFREFNDRLQDSEARYLSKQHNQNANLHGLENARWLESARLAGNLGQAMNAGKLQDIAMLNAAGGSLQDVGQRERSAAEQDYLRREQGPMARASTAINAMSGIPSNSFTTYNQPTRSPSMKGPDYMHMALAAAQNLAGAFGGGGGGMPGMGGGGGGANMGGGWNRR